MHLRRIRVASRLGVSWLGLSLLGMASSAVAQARAGIGDKVPDHEFQPLVDRDGWTKLSEFYGSPVDIAGFKQRLLTVCCKHSDIWLWTTRSWRMRSATRYERS